MSRPIAHALLRCDIAVTNFGYICAMDVCCLLLCFIVPLLFNCWLIYMVKKLNK